MNNNTFTVCQWLRACGVHIKTLHGEVPVVRVVHGAGESAQVIAEFKDTPLGAFQTLLEQKIADTLGGGAPTRPAARSPYFSFPNMLGFCRTIGTVETPEQMEAAVGRHFESLALPQDAKVGTFADLLTPEGKDLHLVETTDQAQEAYITVAHQKAVKTMHKGKPVWDLLGRTPHPDIDGIAAAVCKLAKTLPAEIVDTKEAEGVEDRGHDVKGSQKEGDKEETPVVGDEGGEEASPEDIKADQCSDVRAATHQIKKWMSRDLNEPEVKAALKKMREALGRVTKRTTTRIMASLPAEPLPVKEFVLAFLSGCLDVGVLDEEHTIDFLAYNIISRKGRIVYNPNTGILLLKE